MVNGNEDFTWIKSLGLRRAFSNFQWLIPSVTGVSDTGGDE